MSYQINEGHFNLQVLQDRSLNVLTLEAWGQADPINLTISRTSKGSGQSLTELMAQQISIMSSELQDFQWSSTGSYHSRSAALSFETGRCTYQLGAVAVHQCMAAAAIGDNYVLFLFLSRSQPMTEQVLRQWLHILDAFQPDLRALPLAASVAPGGDEDDGDEEEEDQRVEAPAWQTPGQGRW